MSDPIVYIDRSQIREGKLEELKAALKELVAFVNANEPQLLSYGFYLTEDGARVTVVAVHPDSPSLEFHMKIAGPRFREFTDLIKLSTIEVYGQVSERMLQLLREKAELLGSGSVVVHKPYVGFARLGAR
jgi:quinol monooxygenase YgiN